ncbi:MAG: amidohydrolase family protein [Vicinamibacterales bacterium]
MTTRPAQMSHARRRLRLFIAFIAFAATASVTALAQAPPSARKITAVRAGRLIDPDTGTATPNAVILVEGERITAVGANVPIPAGADIVDLSKLTVLPGLVDAHTHMGITYKEFPENNIYYLTYVLDSSPLRAIQAASNGLQMLASGFTVVRDVGNNGLYVDVALRMAIEQGWLPGPTVIPSGPIIGPMGGQFSPTPEMYKDHKIVYPEYIDADTPDEIVKAVRQNMLFGARTIKLCVDCKAWGFSVDDMKLAIREAAKGGLKVDGHVQTPEGAQRAIDAGLHVISHGRALNADLHKQMAAKGIYLASTDTPFTPYRGSAEAFKTTVEQLRSAYDNKVALTFSTDMDYWNERMKKDNGDWMTRGEITINFLLTWKAARIPAPDVLRAMTTNGYKAADIINERGPIKAGLFADFIAVPGNPLEDIDAVRDVQFVMKNGQIFKRDGVMTPAAMLHPGPVKGWNRR